MPDISQVTAIIRILIHHGLASGQSLVSEVGYGEVRLGAAPLGVISIVLVESTGAGAVHRNYDLGIGRNRAQIRHFVDPSDVGGLGVEKVGDGHRRDIRRERSEDEVGGAAAGSVAGIAPSGGVVLVAGHLLVVDVGLLGMEVVNQEELGQEEEEVESGRGSHGMGEIGSYHQVFVNWGKRWVFVILLSFWTNRMFWVFMVVTSLFDCVFLFDKIA